MQPLYGDDETKNQNKKMNTIKNIKTLKAAISRYELRVTRIERKSDREIIFFARRTSGTRGGSLRNARVAELNYADAVELHAAGRLRKHPLFGTARFSA